MSHHYNGTSAEYAGILVWSMVVPSSGVVAGYLVGSLLGNLFIEPSMIVGFMVGEYVAVQVGRKRKAYNVFLFGIVGWILGGIWGIASGILVGLLVVNRVTLLEGLKAIGLQIKHRSSG